MSDADATPKKIRRHRPTNYPAQLPVMMTQEMYDDIEATAAASSRSRGDVAREWLERGRPADDGDRAPVQAD